MALSEKQCKRITALVMQAVARGLHRWDAGQVEQEPALTDRIFESIETTLELSDVGSVVWRGYNLGDRGRRSPESRYGADGLVVLHALVGGTPINKGFLLQAKFNDRNQVVRPGEYARMKAQCDDMLKVSPTSFIWLYDRGEITVVRARDVVDNASGQVLDVPVAGQTLERFLHSFFGCEIGDRRFRASNLIELERVATDSRIRNGLLLTARTA